MIIYPAFEYFPFLSLLVIIYWRLGQKKQNILLLLSSWVVYCSWDWRYLSLLIISIGVTFFGGMLMHQAKNAAKKRQWFCASMSINLLLLGVFKYYGFFAESLNNLLSPWLGAPLLPALVILLPLGISFYTFQAMSYLLDVYRGAIAPTDSLLSFALYKSYFPIVIAGPIERASNLLVQLGRERHFDIRQIISGIDLLFWAALKKLVVADNIGLYVNMIFALSEPSFGLLLLGGLGFSIQLYLDFSAYTDFARGSSKLMGIELSENFDAPFLARNPTDFWNRWHISLTSWVKDYVYMPIIFRYRRTDRRVVFAFSIVFSWVIIGLWHGAGWNFVAWGLYNGLLIVGYQLLLKPILDVYWLENRLTHGLCILLTGLATSVGAILFRSTSLSSLSSKVILATLHSSYQDSAIILIVIAVYTFYILPLLMVFLGWLYFEKMGFDPVRLWGLRIFSYALVFLLIAIFSGRDQYDFIYFQF